MKFMGLSLLSAASVLTYLSWQYREGYLVGVIVALAFFGFVALFKANALPAYQAISLFWDGPWAVLAIAFAAIVNVLFHLLIARTIAWTVEALI